MIAEAIHDGVPQGPVSSDEFCLNRHDQISLNTPKNDESAVKVLDLQIASLLYTP
jgi:hypothetical protein